MKLSEYMLTVITFYNKMFIPVFLNFISWYGLNVLVGFDDKFLLHSGFILTSTIWIIAIFLTELKNVGK